MASPFPGMDPYLEGYLWSDVHQSLAAQLKRQLGPLVRPNYVVPLDLHTALATVYEESEYNRTVDYQQPPPPPALPAEETAWLDFHLEQAGLRQ